MKKLSLILLTVAFVSNAISAKDTLRVGYSLAPPFVVESENKTLSGPSVWLWENISEELDIHSEFVELSLEESLSGLENDKIDVCMSPITITSERSRTIDFTSPYYIAHSSIMKKQEDPPSVTWQFIKSFFSLNFARSLGALVLVILVFGILIWFFERKKNTQEFERSLKGLWDGFWWSAVTMTTVGYGDKSPQTVGGRIVSLVWMFTAIVIISGFTASIASSLTVDNISSTNSTLEDYNDEKIGTIKNSATSEWLSNNFFNKNKEFQTTEEMLSSLDAGEIEAIAYDRPILQTVEKKDTLSKYELTDFKFNSQFYAFGFNKQLSDSLTEAINYSLLYNIEKMDWKVLLSETGLE